MPNLFERLDESLSGNSLSAKLSLHADNLGGVATTLAGLIKDPPQSLDDLGQALNGLPLPDLDVSSNLGAILGKLKDALPADLSSLLGEITHGLDGLDGSIQHDLSGVLDQLLDAVLAVYRLIRIDLRCQEADAPAGLRQLTLERSESRRPCPGAVARSAGLSRAAGGGANPPTGIEAATAQVDEILAILNLAPSPFNVETFLDWLHQHLSFPIRVKFLPRSLPIFDDLLDPLETLLAWKSLSPLGVRSHIAGSLQDLTGLIRSTVTESLAATVTEAASVLPQLPAVALTEIADELTATLNQLKTAVNSGQLGGQSAAIARITTRLDQYQALRPALQTGVLDRLPALNRHIQDLPDELADRMSHLLSVLQPNGALGVLPQIANAVALPDTATAEEITRQFQPILDWIQSVVDQLNLTAVKEPLKQVADTARGVVDELDQQLAGVAIQVGSLFDEVETLMAEVDTQALLDQAKAAIDGFADDLVGQLNALFQPVKEAVADIVQSIADGVGSFDPEDLVDALREAIQAITGILKDPAVLSALADIRDAIASVTSQLQQLSFSPVTDQVVVAIDDIADILRNIDTSLLDTALKLALQTALEVLPDDLTPVTDPIISEFGDLIDKGPVPLLDTVKQQPEKLLDRIRQFQPSSLIGDSIGKPYRDLLQQTEAFQPSQLLAPVTNELEKLKTRLQQDANPAAAIQLLEQPFQQLLQGFDQLQPTQLVDTLNQAIGGVIDSVLTAVPVDEIFAQIDDALKTVESVVTFSEHVISVLEKLKTLLAGLSDSQPQVNAWIDGILNKVASIADTGALSPRLTDLSAALEGTRSAALSAVFASGIAPLTDALGQLDPQRRLTALVQAYGSFPRPALNALPASPEKTALIAALDRFNPLDPPFGAPYRSLAAYRQAIDDAEAGLQQRLAGWDERYHNPGGVLSGFHHSAATPAELRLWIEDALGPQFLRPVTAFFLLLEPLERGLSSVLTVIQSLIASLRDQIADLLLGPDSLAGIRDAMKALVQRLRDINVDFLAEGLTRVFADLRGKLTAADPAQLRQAIDAAFGQMLATLDIGQVLPAAEVKQLDDTYGQIISGLKALDPEQLVTKLIQPEYEQTVLPLLEPFDMTPLLAAVTDRMRSLDEELRGEMARVNESYRKLQDAIPPISIDLDIDIGVSL